MTMNGNLVALPKSYFDDILLKLGTDGDGVLVLRSAALGANTALTGVLVGTPIVPALAANSVILSNITASGDLIIAGNLGGNSRAYLFIDVSADTLDLLTAGVSRVFLGAAGLVAINDNGNTNMTIGVTINQAGNDDQLLAGKSSDVAHGMTTVAETDTYFGIAKVTPANGGVDLVALTSGGDNISFVLRGHVAADITTKTTAALANILFRAFLKNGTGVQDHGLDANLFAIRNNSTTRFIFDAEGSAHGDVEWIAFSHHDDLALVGDMEAELLAVETEAQTHRRHALEEAGIIGQGSWHMEKGRPRAMVDFTKLAMLHHGALIQVGQRMASLEAENKTLRRMLEGRRN